MVLNNYEEIVTYFESPTLVLAGPGTGKTHLLADRIKRLLDKETDKNTITVLTFGTDAKQHMINKLTDPSEGFVINLTELPRISTMHSLGYKIVQEKPREVNLRKTNLEVQADENVKKLMYRDAAFILGFSEEDGKTALVCKQFGNCREKTEEWRQDYNQIRPHSSLGNIPPEEYAAMKGVEETGLVRFAETNKNDLQKFFLT